MRLVAGRAVADDAVDVLEDEGSPLLGVAVQAGQLADAGHLQGLLARASVRLVAGGAGHPAAAEAVREGLVAERGGLRGVAGGAELRGLLRQQVRGLRLRRVHRVAGEAVHGLRGGMDARLEGRVFLVARVAGDAELRALAPVEGRMSRLVLAARFHVLGARRRGRSCRPRCPRPLCPRRHPGCACGIAGERLGLARGSRRRPGRPSFAALAGAGCCARAGPAESPARTRAPIPPRTQGFIDIASPSSSLESPGAAARAAAPGRNSFTGRGPCRRPSPSRRRDTPRTPRRSGREVTVLRYACAAASTLSWQPRHAAVPGPAARRVALRDDRRRARAEAADCRSMRSSVALQAVPAVARVEDLVEVGRGAAEAVDRVVLRQLLARVDAVDHPLEVDRLGRVLVGRAPAPRRPRSGCGR